MSKSSYQKTIFFLILANAISGLSQGITMISIPWYVNVIKGMQKEFGIFYAVITIVSTFWGLYAGTLIDKFSRKSILVVQNLVGFVLIGGLGILSLLNPESTMVYCLIAFMVTIFIFNLHYPNFFALVQEVTPKNKASKVLSIVEVANQTNSVLGGVMAGILLSGLVMPLIDLGWVRCHIPIVIKPWKMSHILIFDSITYLVAALVAYQIDYKVSFIRTAKSSVAENLKYAWTYLKEDIPFAIFGWFSFGIFVTIILNTYYLAANYISLFLNEDIKIYATQEVFFAFGAIFAGFVARFFLKKKSSIYKILMMFLIAIGVYISFVFNKNLVVYLALTFVLGYTNASTRIYRITYIFNKVPKDLMGRVNSFFNLSSYVLRAILSVLFTLPFFIGEVGIQRVMMVLALFLILCFSLIYYFNGRGQKAE